MQSTALFRAIIAIALTMLVLAAANAGEPFTKCSIPGGRPDCREDTGARRGPTCAIELTCTDKPIRLGYSDGVCFRATCPGIWAIVHKRTDQASFRQRYFTYRHYEYKGNWVLKDQGAIESGLSQFRELFLVLPEDLVEFKLQDPDANAAIEVTNLGYIKKGSVEELKKWLAYNIHLERPVFKSGETEPQNPQQTGSPWSPGSPYGYADIIVRPVNYIGRMLGLPWF